MNSSDLKMLDTLTTKVTSITKKNQDQLPLTVGILIFDQVEVLDVAGPFEVFAVTWSVLGLKVLTQQNI